MYLVMDCWIWEDTRKSSNFEMEQLKARKKSL